MCRQDQEKEKNWTKDIQQKIGTLLEISEITKKLVDTTKEPPMQCYHDSPTNGAIWI